MSSPDSKVGDIRLGPIPQLIWSGILDCFCRASVPHMNQCSKCFTPEGLSQAGLVQHGGETLRQHPISSLCNTILLRPSPDSVLPLNATLCSELQECIAHVLPSFVIPQCLDPVSGLILCIGLELFEAVNHSLSSQSVALDILYSKNSVQYLEFTVSCTKSNKR